MWDRPPGRSLERARRRNPEVKPKRFFPRRCQGRKDKILCCLSRNTVHLTPRRRSHLTNWGGRRKKTASDQFEARSHERKTIPAGASLAAETRASAVGASRLKAGCSQDWLPHNATNSESRMSQTLRDANSFQGRRSGFLSRTVSTPWAKTLCIIVLCGSRRRSGFSRIIRVGCSLTVEARF